MDKIKLKVLGLSYSQTQTGAYALVLEAENSEHRIPIIIGSFEAQAIAIQLENLKPPRPLTHDLFVNIAENLNFIIKEVNIYKLEEGVFHSKLLIKSETGEFEIDARTSDAVALALRFDCPVYTSQEILDKAGLIINIEEGSVNTDPEKESSENTTSETSKPKSKTKLEDKTPDQLNELLQEAIQNEEYEEAARINKEIKKRKHNK